MTEGLVLSARYRLIRQLGAGGMGSVWLAKDLNLETDVAVKLIDAGFVESIEAVDRFKREAQSAALLRSTHVVQILDHGVDKGRPFIAMELLQGEDLAERLERQGSLSPMETGQILAQVGRALTLAHSRGIVHRDLKPENVFLAREGDEVVAKVLDFGIARRTNGLTESSVSKTRTGSMLGTPYYMSPEQATAQPVDYATDVWSFGVIAFECLTGRHAFEGTSVGSLFHAICILPMPVPSEVASVPEGFNEWFACAVARDRTQRFSSMKEAADTLCYLCGLNKGTSGDFSGVRVSVPRDELLSSTIVAGGTTGPLEQTVAPASTTLRGRIRKNPLVSSLVALGGFGIVLLAVLAWGNLLRRTVPPSNPENPLASSQPSAVPLQAVPASSELSPQSAVASAATPEVASPAPSSSQVASKLQTEPLPLAKGAVIPQRVSKKGKLDEPPVTTRTPPTPAGTAKPANTSRDDNAAGI